MHACRVLAAVSAVTLFAACGGDADQSAPLGIDRGDVAPAIDEPRVAESTETVPAAVVPSMPAVAPAAPAAPEPRPAAPVRVQELEQPAIWPAADVVFATPEEAAADFVREVLIVEGEPALGEFLFGDSRSGEIEVLFTGEDGTLDPPMVRGSLALRQLGPDNGWFVLGAGSPGATITAPEALGEVPAGMVVVEGEARGFEGTVVVSAWPAGENDTVLDQELARGGAAAELEAYSVTLDLSGAAPGEVVAIFVQGDTGLGTDPSDFAAIPVVIEDVIPPTR